MDYNGNGYDLYNFDTAPHLVLSDPFSISCESRSEFRPLRRHLLPVLLCLPEELKGTGSIWRINMVAWSRRPLFMLCEEADRSTTTLVQCMLLLCTGIRSHYGVQPNKTRIRLICMDSRRFLIPLMFALQLWNQTLFRINGYFEINFTSDKVMFSHEYQFEGNITLSRGSCTGYTRVDICRGTVS